MVLEFVGEQRVVVGGAVGQIENVEVQDLLVALCAVAVDGVALFVRRTNQNFGLVVLLLLQGCFLGGLSDCMALPVPETLVFW